MIDTLQSYCYVIGVEYYNFVWVESRLFDSFFIGSSKTYIGYPRDFKGELGRNGSLQDMILLEKISREIRPVIEGMGYSIVEVKVGRSRGISKVSVVIYSNKGVTLKNCEEVSRLIYPSLEMMEEIPDLTLEVSSPGIDRVIKDDREYEIFNGRGLQIIMKETNEKVQGILVEADKDYISLKNGDVITRYRKDAIRKARLRDF